ncbi:ribonuclease P protein component [Dokdonia sinensis]|uniref:Ribonuclease P protein component n=1 Tax=Dokdonia sinensis TaxID=2479847 RepID=A0A3M0GDJ9_9FLAO|nr:ribonuclease P protein component [Dokdonia sinensis]RMB63241.1 ribonuclease P protein component [Dokdonia sinensis]
MRNTYPKREKLKSKKRIERLFEEGRSVKSYPLRMVYLPEELSPETQDLRLQAQVGVSISKRNFKLAVHRNRIKRLMREAYRLNKGVIDTKGTTFVMLIIYTGREELTQHEVSKAMVKLLKRFNDAITPS